MAKVKTLVALLLLLGSSVKTLPLEDESSDDEDGKDNGQAEASYRLSSNAVPIHYNIKLIPYLEVDNFTFDGETSIDLKIQKATEALDFHMKKLTLDETATYLESRDGQRYEAIDFTYVNTTEIMKITFEKLLQPGLYTFRTKFAGIIHDDLRGFYKSSYTNDDGDTVWLVTTQFEATYARRAFPCWDEPSLKATFNVSIKHYPNYTALSNMPAYERSAIDENDGKIWTHFQRTPVMSTYILAFVVSDFVRVPNADGTINVWARQNAIPGIGFGHEVAQKANALLEKYTNSSVRVPKMDHVLIPDFRHGAMENWGLVTYAEHSFLYYPNKTDEETKSWTAMVITHEVTHQWFGNVVSPSWWSHVWLNEGFASYFQFYITNKILPKWRLMEFFVPRVQHYAFDADQQSSEGPIGQNLSSPTNIEKTFSALTYMKAASLLRMLSHVITDEVFRLGLVKYLQKYQYGNASPDDLWVQFQKVVDETPEIPRGEFRVKEMMDTWIYQRRYPLVTVTRNYVTGEATIAQEIFHSRVTTEDEGTIDHDDDVDKRNRWWIPINYATRAKANFSDTLPTHWLKPKNENITIGGIDADDWLILNVQQTGHYRVNYDEKNWLKLAKYLNSPEYEKINVLNRVQIICDSFNLLIKKMLNLTIFLELTNYLSRETDYVVWYATFEFIINWELTGLLETTDGYKILRPHILNLMSAVIDSVGFDLDYKDDYVTRIKKLKVKEYACKFGHRGCAMKANADLVAFLESPDKDEYSSHLRGWTFCSGMNYANESTWNKMLAMYLNQTYLPITNYLCCIKNLTIIEKYLNMTIAEDSPFSEKDCNGIFEELFYVGDPAIVDVTTDFVFNNWDVLVSRKNLQRFLPMVLVEQATNKDQLRKIKSFLEYKKIKPDRLQKREQYLTEVDRIFDTFRAWRKSKESNSV